MKIYELASGSIGPEIDKQLQGIGDGINQKNAQPDGFQQPDPNMPPGMDEEPDTEEEQPKKVDPYLVAAVKGMPYVNDYKFDDDSKIAPYNLLQRSFGELMKVRGLVRAKINMKTMNDQFGLYDDPVMKFYQDMMAFIEKSMMIKKKMEKGEGSTGSESQKAAPNNPAAKSNVR